MSDNVNRKHCYEMFLYRVRGHVKNVNQVRTQTSFNVEPIPPHASDTDVDGIRKSSVTLIGNRMLKTDNGMNEEGDVFPVLQSTKFICTNAPVGMKDGDYHELHIDETEAQRIKPFMANPNLVVNVAGML